MSTTVTHPNSSAALHGISYDEAAARFGCALAASDLQGLGAAQVVASALEQGWTAKCVADEWAIVWTFSRSRRVYLQVRFAENTGRVVSAHDAHRAIRPTRAAVVAHLVLKGANA